MKDNEPDWPPNIIRPSLPEGYSWVCLRRAWGIGEWPDHPWWIRVSFEYKKSGKTHHRFVKMESQYFITPDAAIEYAQQPNTPSNKLNFMQKSVHDPAQKPIIKGARHDRRTQLTTE